MQSKRGAAKDDWPTVQPAWVKTCNCATSCDHYYRSGDFEGSVSDTTWNGTPSVHGLVKLGGKTILTMGTKRYQITVEEL